MCVHVCVGVWVCVCADIYFGRNSTQIAAVNIRIIYFITPKALKLFSINIFLVFDLNAPISMLMNIINNASIYAKHCIINGFR